MRARAVLPALLVLAGCAKSGGLACGKGFDALRSTIVADAKSSGTAIADEYLETYFVDHGRVAYFVSTPKAPGHPMILQLRKVADKGNATSGCGYGDQAAYRHALHQLKTFRPID